MPYGPAMCPLLIHSRLIDERCEVAERIEPDLDCPSLLPLSR